jgi:hypothetical protein
MKEICKTNEMLFVLAFRLRPRVSRLFLVAFYREKSDCLPCMHACTRAVKPGRAPTGHYKKQGKDIPGPVGRARAQLKEKTSAP